MANKDDYLTYYREFFENFAQTVNPNDQLPVKLGSYKLINLEVVGGVIDWTTQYLTQKKCPQSLIAPLIQIVIDETRKACKKQPLACGFNPIDNAYEPLKLMQTVMAITNEICLRYLDNSMLCSLPSPGMLGPIVSVSAAKNKRRRMEDRHVVINDLNTMFNFQECTPSSYYAIFDGHAGHDAAAYSAAHLHQFLAENKHFATDPEQALLEAFYKTDNLFIEKCNVERFNSGTTAVCALLRPKEKKLYIAWVGDSQAVLVNQGRDLQCVSPHKPCREDEKQRIEKQGGYVCYWGTWRVNGQLAVSRAIGDAEYKPYVIAVPDIRVIPLDGSEDFLILACDGLWDFVSEKDASRAVYEMVCQQPDETDRISEQLVYLSKERGSTDNISVIVVFLREPSKIAAEAHWANRNASSNKMDTSLDNANNPFANSNGADNNIIGQKSDGLLLNLSETFKQNGANLSPTGTGDFYHNSEKSNGKRLASEFDDDDLGPETDVDAIDDVLSPSIAAAKALAEGIVNNNPDGSFNPFVTKHEVEKAALEIDLDLQKQQSSEFDGQRSPREETPTPPADAVHDAGLEENLDESGEDSEEEWNYIKGEEANKENISPSQPDCEVAENLDDQEDNMSQLNPNAAEFVPVSPTRSIPSPVCRLIHDPVIAQSPKRPSEIDINLPNLQDFEKEVKSRPSDVDALSNGHDEEGSPKSQDLIENLLNGKNIDEIPEFQPGSTPSKTANTEEFHFGPNAARFTPVVLLDQSEAGLSTKAVFGDESTLNLDSTLDNTQDNIDFAKLKEDDPMSMSFYQNENSSDPFDLNKVHTLPDDDDDDFLNKLENKTLHEDTENEPPKDEILLDNDERIQTTDLDKGDDEKELASPVSNDDESSGVCELAKSPLPHIDDIMNLDRDRIDQILSLPEGVGIASESTSDKQLVEPEERKEELVSFSEPEEILEPETQILSPEPECKDSFAPSPDLCLASKLPILETASPEPIENVCSIVEKAETLEVKEVTSPEPEEITSPEPEKVTSTEPELLTETVVEVEDKRELSVESPLEDVTSSVKDACSPIHSPFGDQERDIQLSFAQEINNAIQSTVSIISPPVQENTVSELCVLSSPKSVADTESVATTDVNSFLERSEIVDLTSPLSPAKSEVVDLTSSLDPADSTITNQEALLKCVFPLPTEIETENITPQFAESVVISPTEPKEAPSAPSLEEIEKEPEVVEEIPVAAVAAAGAIVAGAAAAVIDKKPAKTKPPAIKKTAATPTKTITSPAKAKPVPIAKTKSSTTPKTATTRTSTGTAGTTPTAAKTTGVKAAPKPKTPTTRSSLEKKSVVNGDVKAPVRTTLLAKKSVEGAKAQPPKPASTLNKASSAKPAAARPSTAPTKTIPKSPAAPKPRPTTLPSKPLASSTVTRTTSATKTNPARTTTTTTGPKPPALSKPRPSTAPAKPKVAATRTLTKPSVDVEKQSKDSANKLTASRTLTSTRTTGTASAKTSSTVRKTDVKTSGTTRTTVTKTTTTTMRPVAGGKKSLETLRNGTTKTTKITKTETPVENGVTTVVTEESTIVNNALNNGETLLLKDNSPIDNKLLVETNTAD